MGLSPIAFSIGNFEIRWYGILIATAMLIGTTIASYNAKNHDIEKEKIVDMLLLCVPLGVIGARLYYVLFNWSYYNGDLLKILDIRSGGLAIHGGLIFGAITLWIMSKINNLNILNVLDLIVPSVALGQAIGRWGNFFNKEAYGSPTDLPWGININGESVHPTFLYESVWCILIFIIVSMINRKRDFNGESFLIYGILYSLERFFVEYLRTDSLMLFGYFKQAMVLSLAVFIIFLIIFVYKKRKMREKKLSFHTKKSKYIDRY